MVTPSHGSSVPSGVHDPDIHAGHGQAVPRQQIEALLFRQRFQIFLSAP